MFSTHLIQLLRTLTPAEMRGFEKYVHSPYFHSHEDTIRFFEVLCPHHPDYDQEALSSEAVFAVLYPRKPYRDEVMRTLRKYLLQLLVNFLVSESVKADVFWTESVKLKVLTDRGQNDYFLRQYRQAEKTMGQVQQKDLDFMLREYLLKNRWVDFAFLHNPRHQPPDLTENHRLLDQFFLTSKLQFYCSELNLDNVLGREQTPVPDFLGVLLPVLWRDPGQQPVILQAYMHCMHMLRGEEGAEASFFHLLDLLTSAAEQFSRVELTNLYGFSINFANRAYRKGKSAFLAHMFRIYQIMFGANLLFEGGSFSVHNYRNITTLALRLGNYEWAEQFIEDAAALLPPEHRTGAYAYNKAHLCFYQQKYGEALKLLQNVDLLDPLYQLSFRLLQLKLFLELGDVETFLSHAQTFRMYLHRQSDLPDTTKSAYNNFIRFSRLLLNQPEDKEKLPQLLADFEASDSLVEKEWLTEKVQRLIASGSSRLPGNEA